MANTGNLPADPNVNSTATYFNNYFTERFTTSPDINDAVVGYFQQITGDAEVGKTLASTVIYTALSQDLDPMSLVDEFRKLKAGKYIEQKTPIDPSQVISSYTSYNQVVQHKDEWEVGTLFYVESNNLFYRSIIDPVESSGAIQIQTASGYRAERIILGNNQFAYNYYFVTTTQERDELTPYLTVLLNTNRVGTSLLGISNQPQTNKYIQRAIRA